MKVATGNRCPVRSECHNFGRVLRGCPWKCLEEGRETSMVNVATGNRCPVRSECRNFGRVLRGWSWQFLEEGRETSHFGRVLRGWSWQFLEEGRETSQVNVATVKRHPVRSECHSL